MTHSIIPPSSAEIWVNCPGWVVMAQSFPETEESEASRLGTAAHEVAAQYIDSYARGKAYNPKVGDITSNNVIIDDEMLDACELYADSAREVMISSNVFGGPHFGLESPLTMPRINEYSFGTSDLFIFDHKNLTLYIYDFKYGHDPVEVFENWQLINYAAGVIEHLVKFTPFLLDSMSEKLTIVFRIAQPRSFHRDGPIREWRTTLGNLWPYFERLKEAATLALSGIGKTQSGPHCRYCQARHGCESALGAAVRLYEVAAQALPLDMDKQSLAVQYAILTRAVKQIEAVKDAIGQQIETLIRTGHNVPGYTTQPKQGRETWSTPIEEVFALGDMMGVDLRKPSAVTPKQAVKLGIDINVIKEYSHKTSSGLEIVQDDGKKARLIFGAK